MSKQRLFQFHLASLLTVVFVSGLVLAIGSIPPQKDASHPQYGFSTGWPWTVYTEGWVHVASPDPVTPLNSNGFQNMVIEGPVYRSHWYWESVPFNALIAFVIGFAAALPIEILLRVRRPDVQQPSAHAVTT